MCILNYFVATLFKDYFQQLDRAAILKCTSGCLLLTVLVVVVAVVNFERAWSPYDQRYQHTCFLWTYIIMTKEEFGIFQFLKKIIILCRADHP